MSDWLGEAMEGPAPIRREFSPGEGKVRRGYYEIPCLFNGTIVPVVYIYSGSCTRR